MRLFFANEFSCLSNALTQAGLTLSLPVALDVPPRARRLIRGQLVAASDIVQVRLHQCPQEHHVRYRLDIHACDGRHWDETFLDQNDEHVHDTYILYDRWRDGVVQYIHVVH